MRQTIYRSEAFIVDRFDDGRATVYTRGHVANIPADKASPLGLTLRAINANSPEWKLSMTEGIDAYLARWHKRYVERCMKCRTAPALLSLRGNDVRGEWRYCADCTHHAMYGEGDGLGSLALLVGYITPLDGRDRESLPSDAQALCR